MICFKAERDAWEQDQWSWVLSNFEIEEAWQRGDGIGVYQKPKIIQTAADLPDRPLVVLSHPEARYVRGEESLKEFVHPGDAIYFFGGSMANLTLDELGGRKPHALVYIPTKLEMYSHAAAYVTLWDRYLKRG